jgi:hypothetical protein
MPTENPLTALKSSDAINNVPYNKLLYELFIKKVKLVRCEKSTASIFFLNTYMLTRQPSRSLCGNCKVSPVKPNGTSKNGFKKWHKYCASCAKAAYDKKFGYLLDKKNTCEQCDFIPQDKCQLDRIYLDGNTKNKLTANIKTLCANCNRIYQKKLKESSSSIMDITVDADILI